MDIGKNSTILRHLYADPGDHDMNQTRKIPLIITIIFLFFQLIVFSKESSAENVLNEANHKQKSLAVPDDQAIDKSEKIKKHYPVYGAAFGPPAWLNLVAGYYFYPFGIRISGMYFYYIYGIQANFLVSLGDYEFFQHSISILAGFSMLTANYMPHFGVSYDLNFYNFFFEIGGVLHGASPTLSLIFQIGYVVRFNKF